LENWNVDIGDRIVKGQEVARLSVPELGAELQQKKAQVKLDEAQVQVAERVVEVASTI
jgi:multidrug efflux pump subunit AcrA (membrane-fusion protein)